MFIGKISRQKSRMFQFAISSTRQYAGFISVWSQKIEGNHGPPSCKQPSDYPDSQDCWGVRTPLAINFAQCCSTSSPWPPGDDSKDGECCGMLWASHLQGADPRSCQVLGIDILIGHAVDGNNIWCMVFSINHIILQILNYIWRTITRLQVKKLK